MKKNNNIELSVIIPCYNEVSTIEELINKVNLAKPRSKEIIVVDDGSKDGTVQLLKKIQNQIDCLIIKEKNEGKGSAIKIGIKKATGKIIIFQDADLEYNPNEYEKIIDPIRSGVADVVYGSRFSGGDRRRVLFFWHKVANQVLTLFSNIFTNLNLTDMETCFKAFNSKVIKDIHLQEKRFGLEPEITAKIAKKEVRIFEVGITYNGRTYNEGKKIGWKDAVSALYCIVKYNVFTK
jgi:glycosyltransferase involved in cell wall biosynthesis